MSSDLGDRAAVGSRPKGEGARRSPRSRPVLYRAIEFETPAPSRRQIFALAGDFSASAFMICALRASDSIAPQRLLDAIGSGGAPLNKGPPVRPACKTLDVGETWQAQDRWQTGKGEGTRCYLPATTAPSGHAGRGNPAIEIPNDMNALWCIEPWTPIKLFLALKIR